MEITTKDYSIRYDAASATISCQGSLRLNGSEEYAPIVEILDQAAQDVAGQLILDLRQLEFLNSSGINMLSKFVIRVRQQGDLQMVVQGSQQVPWQGKSLKNLQRLMPKLQLELQ